MTVSRSLDGIGCIRLNAGVGLKRYAVSQGVDILIGRIHGDLQDGNSAISIHYLGLQLLYLGLQWVDLLGQTIRFRMGERDWMQKEHKY